MSTMHNETGIKSIPVVMPAPLPPPLPPPIEVVPVAEAMPAPKAEPKATPKSRDRSIRENGVYTLAAWFARFVVGVVMCANVFPVSFITAIAVFGWLQRRMQAVALRGWWRASPRRLEGTFQDFCDSLGLDAPVERPRWFWRERIMQNLGAMSKRNGFTGFVRMAFGLVTLPIHSLLLNFKVGIAGLFTTYMLMGPGCFIMLFSWYFGWFNSFHKGYEDAFLGFLAGLLGSFLLVLSLVYVPMAQAHQAAAGEIAAFFQFRVVLRLILTRLTAYVMLLGGIALASLFFEIPRLWTVNPNFAANLKETKPNEAFWILQRHWIIWSIFFFFAMIVLRTLSTVIYRSAMLKAVHAGTILTSDLPPRLAIWFEKLEILPQAQLPQNSIMSLLKSTISLKYRIFLFGATFFILTLFIMRFYVGIFLVFSEYRGLLNHPVVQVPCIDWTPWHLVRGDEE